MRITGGLYKGREVFAPKGINTRPMLERLRKSLFDVLGNYVDFKGFFLDLYAGSGVLGIEYMSRGGLGGVFVEKSRKAVEAIRSNLKKLGIDGVEVVKGDVKKIFDRVSGSTYQVIFIDPPFELGYQEFFRRYMELLEDRGLVVLRLFKKAKYPELPIVDERVYGESRILLLGKG